MKKIFVGNLAWKVTEEELKAAFEAYGEVVSVKIIKDQFTGRSKGFAFVEMADAESAEKSIKGLNDQPMQDRNIRVSIANDRPERSERPSRGGPGGGERREYRGSREGGDRGDRGGRFSR